MFLEQEHAESPHPEMLHCKPRNVSKVSEKGITKIEGHHHEVYDPMQNLNAIKCLFLATKIVVTKMLNMMVTPFLGLQ